MGWCRLSMHVRFYLCSFTENQQLFLSSRKRRATQIHLSPLVREWTPLICPSREPISAMTVTIRDLEFHLLMWITAAFLVGHEVEGSEGVPNMLGLLNKPITSFNETRIWERSEKKSGSLLTCWALSLFLWVQSAWLGSFHSADEDRHMIQIVSDFLVKGYKIRWHRTILILGQICSFYRSTEQFYKGCSLFGSGNVRTYVYTKTHLKPFFSQK